MDVHDKWGEKMKILTEKSVMDILWHIATINYALLHGDESQRLDATEDLVSIVVIIGGTRLLKEIGGIKTK